MSQRLLSQSDSVHELHQSRLHRDDHAVDYSSTTRTDPTAADSSETEQWTPRLIPRSIKMSLKSQTRPRIQ